MTDEGHAHAAHVESLRTTIDEWCRRHAVVELENRRLCKVIETQRRGIEQLQAMIPKRPENAAYLVWVLKPVKGEPLRHSENSP